MVSVTFNPDTRGGTKRSQACGPALSHHFPDPDGETFSLHVSAHHVPPCENSPFRDSLGRRTPDDLVIRPGKWSL
jgi:hypothetical protein